jgi:hypothetical protein
MKSVKEAFEIIKHEIKNNPDYANSWHSNIAMAVYDTMTDPHEEKHFVSNEAATRFIKSYFDVETKA